MSKYEISHEQLQHEVEALCDILKRMKYMQDRDITAKHQLIEIAQALLLEKYEQGQMVFDHSQIGDRLYFVLSGSVKVEKPEVIQLSDAEKQMRKNIFDHKEETIQWAIEGITKLQERKTKIAHHVAQVQKTIDSGNFNRTRNNLYFNPGFAQNSNNLAEENSEQQEVERDPSKARMESVFHLQDKLQGKKVDMGSNLK